MKSIMKKSEVSLKRIAALKITKKSMRVSRMIKKSKKFCETAPKKLEVGGSFFVSKKAKMRVILPREEHKFCFTLSESAYSYDDEDVEIDIDDGYDYPEDSPVEDEEDDVELDIDDDDSPVSDKDEDDIGILDHHVYDSFRYRSIVV